MNKESIEAILFNLVFGVTTGLAFIFLLWVAKKVLL